ncbi:MAG TPA: hypothetical protein VIU41_08985 [Geobacteraceae bacterium]
MEELTKNATLDRDLVVRLQRALTGGSEELFATLQDHTVEVLQAALRNPALGESHLLALLSRPDLPEALLKTVYRHPLTGESHRVKVAMVHHPATPGPELLALLPHLHLFELVTVCTIPGITPDQKVAAERAIIQRLPFTPLGNKLTLARRGSVTVVAALLGEGHPQVVEACLASPRLQEGAVFQFLRSAASSAETISMVARHPRWQSRPNLRQAILSNPRTPLIWFTVWLPAMTTPELKLLLSSQRLNPQQKREVTALLKKRGL